VGVGDDGEGQLGVVARHGLGTEVEHRHLPHPSGDELGMTVRERSQVQVTDGASRVPAELQVHQVLGIGHPYRAGGDRGQLAWRDEVADLHPPGHAVAPVRPGAAGMSSSVWRSG
jgi:hypothetical protein